jgi:hypothetical protein
MGGRGGDKLHSVGLLHFISRLYCTGNCTFIVRSIIILPLFLKYREKENHTLSRSAASILCEAEAAYHQIYVQCIC